VEQDAAPPAEDAPSVPSLGRGEARDEAQSPRQRRRRRRRRRRRCAALRAHAVVAQPVVPPTATPITGTDTIVKLLAGRSFRFTVHDTGFEVCSTSARDPLQRIVYGDLVRGPHCKGPWRHGR
jgi:hypothetical protein